MRKWLRILYIIIRQLIILIVIIWLLTIDAN